MARNKVLNDKPFKIIRRINDKREISIIFDSLIDEDKYQNLTFSVFGTIDGIESTLTFQEDRRYRLSTNNPDFLEKAYNILLDRLINRKNLLPYN